jgi:protein pelota
MKILFQDPHTGLLRLRLETPSDLWRLSRLVQTGDRVGASTTRRDPEVPQDTPAGQRARRTVFLTIRTENVEFHEFTGHVRITGPIVEGPFDIGRFHTLDLEEGSDLAITKDSLSPADRTLLEEGRRGADEPQVLIVAADWGDVAVVRLRGRTLSVVDERSRGAGGKYDRVKSGAREKAREDFLQEVVDVVVPELPKSQAVVLTGPGFFKEELAQRLSQLSPPPKAKVTVAAAAEAGLAGVHELLRSGKAEEALSGSLAARESAEVERLLLALGKEGGAALGPAELKGAVEAGAVETLLVLDTKLRDAAVVPILEAARAARSAVLVVRGDAPPGKRLAGLGGMGGVLRFPWRPGAG